MKVTKRQLKQIIKEEIEATMQEQGGDEMAQAKELAQVLAKSPAVMAAVEQAAQDPEVQAAAQGDAIQEALPVPRPYTDDEKLAKSGNIAASAGISSGAIMMVASAATGIPAIMALGIAGGPMMMAIGMLIKHAIDSGKI